MTVKKILLCLFFLNLCLISYSQYIHDTLSNEQIKFFTTLIQHLKRPLWIDSSRLANKERICFYQISPEKIEISYDDRSYYIDSEGRRRYEMAADGGGNSCFAFDSRLQTLEDCTSGGGFGPSVYHKAWFRDTTLLFEIFNRNWSGSSQLELYDSAGLLYKNSDISAFIILPHPLLKEKKIVIASNRFRSPVEIKHFTLLTTSGKGSRKRYLIEVVSDTTNKFYPVEESFVTAVSKRQYHFLQRHPGQVFVELSDISFSNSITRTCGYTDYYRVKDMYLLPVEIQSIETVFSAFSDVRFTPTILGKPQMKNQPRYNSEGFVNNRSQRFVQALNAAVGFRCPYLESVDPYNKSRIEKFYAAAFRDDFILFLNKEMLRL